MRSDMELNVAFVEAFKDLEYLCNQIYNDHHGVTCYINNMDEKMQHGMRTLQTWEADYRTLKRLRHMRNQLNHPDSGISYSDFYATEQDIAYLKQFRQRILNQTDPLTVLRKKKAKSQAYQSLKHTFAPPNNDLSNRQFSNEQSDDHWTPITYILIAMVLLLSFLSIGFALWCLNYIL